MKLVYILIASLIAITGCSKEVPIAEHAKNGLNAIRQLNESECEVAFHSKGEIRTAVLDGCKIEFGPFTVNSTVCGRINFVRYGNGTMFIFKPHDFERLVKCPLSMANTEVNWQVI